MKQLNYEESQKVLDLFDDVCTTCGQQPFTPLLRLLDKQITPAGISQEAFWNLIFKEIGQAIGSAFVQMGNELEKLINNPEKLAEMADLIQKGGKEE